MAVGTEIHKRSFQTGLDTGDAAFINVGFFLFTRAGFNVQVKQSLSIDQSYAQLFGVSCIYQHSFHGKGRVPVVCDDRKPGISSAKQNVRAAALRIEEQADGQTSQMVAGKSPAYPSLPPTIRLHECSEGSNEVDVCRRMLSVFRFTLAPWVSRRIRMLDGPALRAGKDFSRCRPTVFRKVSVSRQALGFLFGVIAPEAFSR
jgi:hypothetical protein